MRWSVKEIFAVPRDSRLRVACMGSQGDPAEPSPTPLRSAPGLCLAEHAGKGFPSATLVQPGREKGAGAGLLRNPALGPQLCVLPGEAGGR